MNNLENKTVFELAQRLNQIELEIRDLSVEYNSIVGELKERLPNLKDDKNLEPKVIKKVKER